MDDIFGIIAQPGVFAAVLGAVAGLATFFTLGLSSRRRLELRAAMAWLNDLKWRDFARVLTGLLAQRGLQPHEAERKPGDDGFDLLMVRGTSRYLVQCKHGAAFRLNAASLRELSKVMGMQGADGAIVLTTGRSEPGARALAENERIEIIDQEPLWTQLRPLLPESDRKRIETLAEQARNRRLAAVVAAALLAGGAGYVLSASLQAPRPAQDASAVAQSPAPATTPAPVQPAPVAAAPTVAPAEPAAAVLPSPDSGDAAQAASQAAASGSPSAVASPEAAPTSEAQVEASRQAVQALAEIAQLDEAQLEARRQQAAAMAARVRGIERADWQTRSTLVIGLAREWIADPDGAAEAVCVELVKFEELRYTRIQLEAADADPAFRVRWRQCR